MSAERPNLGIRLPWRLRPFDELAYFEQTCNLSVLEVVGTRGAQVSGDTGSLRGLPEGCVSKEAEGQYES